MKSFEELTRQAKILRLRRLAKVALAGYGLGDARFKLIRLAGNAVFRVYDSQSILSGADSDLFEKDQYLLRIHDKREQPTDAIKLEMEWLKAMRRDAGLPVPEPVPALDGRLLIRTSIPDVIEEHDCTLLRWVKGRYVIKNIQPYHFRAQGRIMAQLHNHASQWQPPDDYMKRRFDRAGLFENDAGAGMPNSKAWPLLPPKYSDLFRQVADKTKQVMEAWGKDPQLYGLIHADCGIDANVLFRNCKARIIDFDGSGFGYYIYDLCLAVEHCWESNRYFLFREALLEGYAEYRPLPLEQLKCFELFLSGFYVYMSLWSTAVACLRLNPAADRSRFDRWRERGLRFIKRNISNF